MRVAVEGVSIDIGGVPLVGDATLAAEPGTFVGIVGPNGSGKSTLLRALYRALKPVAGMIHLGGEELAQLTARESARRTAVVVQEQSADFEFSVHEVVATGRSPHKGLLDRDDSHDDDVIASALRRVGASDLMGRLFTTLSGGEKQRVLVARALAQESKILILDEPTNHLDIRAQYELLELVRGLELTVIAALHDFNLAAAYCDRLYVMWDGGIAAEGTPEAVLNPELLSEVFGVRVHCSINPLNGRVSLSFAPLPTDTSS
ncbi:MAG: ABC transporter ATP-binding protein [Actinomycetota bacterium]